MNIKAQPVKAKRKIARANKLLPLAFPFLSVDLNGIKPITKKFTFRIINHFSIEKTKILTCLKIKDYAYLLQFRSLSLKISATDNNVK